MPDLSQSLQGRDLGHLRIVSELWGIGFDAPDARTGLARLCPLIIDRKVVQEGIATLPSEARLALDELVKNGGRLSWALFTRRYGIVREMGPGRRDRERPYRTPASPAEALWYRALVARAFFDASGGPEEYAYIPDDLLGLIPVGQNRDMAPLGRPATPGERLGLILASDRILDHACTLLAALRLGLDQDQVQSQAASWGPENQPLRVDALRQLLYSASLLDDDGLPQPEPTRLFLEASRGEALAMLAQAWLHSETFNDLRMVPGLSFEGEWKNDPLQARRKILGFLSTVPVSTWWSLPAFIAQIREQFPDYQRPAGDYDSWFIRDEKTGEFLRGFAAWNEVDGALVHFILAGPLHWLGVLDLAAPTGESFPTAFRISGKTAVLLKGEAPQGLPLEDATMHVRSDARLVIPRLAPRVARYQVARFSQWEGETENEYRYRLTPASLARARGQGLATGHLVALLRRYAVHIPPSLGKALERWEKHGAEARLEQVAVLRLASPEMLQAVRSSRAARFLGEPLGPTTVIIKPGAMQKVLAILAELGYLGELEPGKPDDPSQTG